MSTIKKADNIKYGGGAIVVKDLKSHANDPFVLKKVEQAKAILSKVTLPGSRKK